MNSCFMRATLAEREPHMPVLFNAAKKCLMAIGMVGLVGMLPLMTNSLVGLSVASNSKTSCPAAPAEEEVETDVLAIAAPWSPKMTATDDQSVGKGPRLGLELHSATPVDVPLQPPKA
jgi:hypothetical protein